jgi:hypothetical protein
MDRDWSSGAFDRRWFGRLVGKARPAGVTFALDGCNILCLGRRCARQRPIKDWERVLMRRRLSMVGLMMALVMTILFSMKVLSWQERNASAGNSIAQSPDSNTLVLTAVSPLATPTPLASPTDLPATPTAEVATALPVITVTVDTVTPTPTATPLPPRPTATLDESGVIDPKAKTPTPTPPSDVNGVPIDKFVVMPADVRQHMHEIYARGQSLGNDPRAFSKIGDSTIETPYFMARFESNLYKLGDYAYLKPTINYYYGSFSRQSVAVRIGMHSWTVLNAAWADKTHCNPNESPAACEFRLHKPSVVLIRLGANDVEVPKLFKESMQQVISYCLQSGVIPVVSTKPDRFQDPQNTTNEIIRGLAADYRIPLWDFDLVAQTLPDRGLSQDSVHMTDVYIQDYSSPVTFQNGHPVQSLTALIMLDEIRRELTQSGP